MKAMQKNNMASESVKSFNRSGLLTVSDAHVQIFSGTFLKYAGIATNDLYSYFMPTGQTTKNFNVFEMAYPVADDVTAAGVDLYIADPVDVSSGLVMGNLYKIGAKTLGVAVPADQPCAIRKLVQDDMFFLTSDCFVSAPTVGQFATLTAASGQLTPAATAPATGFYVEILDTKNFIEGLDATATGFLVRVARI